VVKVQYKPIKRSKLGFKRKEQKKPKRTLVWRTGQCPVLRAVRLQTCHLRVSGEPLRYNSPDCPVCQWRNGSSATVDCNGHLQKCYNAWTVRVESEQPPEGAPDSKQCLSGAAPNCPVPPRSQSSNGRNRQNPNGWVTWLAHRTVRCAHRQTASPTVELVVGAINTPQPPPLQASKHSLLLIQYRSKIQHSKTQIKASDPIKVHNSTLVF
jgi:hypothetical protein